MPGSIEAVLWVVAADGVLVGCAVQTRLLVVCSFVCCVGDRLAVERRRHRSWWPARHLLAIDPRIRLADDPVDDPLDVLAGWQIRRQAGPAHHGTRDCFGLVQPILFM